jgi:tetratricopeptide (TPR) repeat protein
MPTPPTRRALIVTATACVAVMHALAAPAMSVDDLPRASRDHWIEVRSPNFTFVSQAGERLTERLAVELEELHSVLSRLAGGSLKDPVPTTIFIFERSRDFDEYVYRRNDEPVSASGYFLGREETNRIAIDASRRDQATGVVFHEFTHEVLSVRLPGLPLCLEEGLAELYQTFRITDDGAEIGRPIDHHLARLADRGLMPIDALLAVDKRSPMYTETSRQGDFYAQSWALTHMLLLGDDELAAATRGFFEQVRRTGRPVALFRSTYGPDFSALDERLRDYVQRRTFRFVRIPVQPGSIEISDARDLSPAEVLERLGELLALQDPPHPAANAHLVAAVERDPSSARALSAQALLAEDRARWGEARILHDRAVAARTDDPVVLFRRARFDLARHAEVERAAHDLERCTQLDPGYGPCWARLAEALLNLDRTGPDAVRAAAIGYRLLPDRPDVSANLFELLVRNDRFDDASDLIDVLEERRPNDARSARARLAEARLRRARELVIEDRLDDARHEVTQVARLIPDAARSSSLEARVASVSAAIERRRLQDRLIEARRLLDAGDPDAARQIAADVRQDPACDASVHEAADRLILEIDEPDAVKPAPRTFATVSEREIDELNRLLAAGDLDAAATLLESIDARVSPDQRDWIDAKLDEIRRAREHNLFAEAYNRAIHLLEAGNPAAAEAELTSLLETLPDGPDAEQARKLLERVREVR